MLKKRSTISLNLVYDNVRFAEGAEHLDLYVAGDPMRMVAGLNEAQRRMKALTDTSTPEEMNAAAKYFASVIFGAEQAGQIMEFYHNDPACVINVCGRYFSGFLAKKIEQAQRKAKPRALFGRK